MQQKTKINAITKQLNIYKPAVYKKSYSDFRCYSNREFESRFPLQKAVIKGCFFAL